MVSQGRRLAAAWREADTGRAGSATRGAAEGRRMKGLGQVRLRQGGAVAVTHDVERAGQVVVQALKDRLVGAIAELIPHVGVGHDEPSVLVAVRQQGKELVGWSARAQNRLVY